MAQNDLGSRYYAGRGVERDDAEAARWIQLAADQGYAPAQFNLGLAPLPEPRFGSPCLTTCRRPLIPWVRSPGKPTLTLVTSGTNAQTATTLSSTIPCVSPGNAPVTDYVLFAERTSDNLAIPAQFFTPVPWPGHTVTATVTGLTAATRYRVRAFARNLVGRNSAMSDWVQGTTAAMQIDGAGSSDSEPTDPLTASFEQVPSEHAGNGTFDLLVCLSETVGNFSKSPRASSFDVHVALRGLGARSLLVALRSRKGGPNA